MGRWLWESLGSDEGKKAFILVPWFIKSPIFIVSNWKRAEFIIELGLRSVSLGHVFDLCFGLCELLGGQPCSAKEFHLSPWNFDFSERSKYGEKGRFPTNLQFKAHFQSFLRSGYEAHREPVDVRFPAGADVIEPFSVQFVDGQNKMLIIQTILALLEVCDFWMVKIWLR